MTTPFSICIRDERQIWNAKLNLALFLWNPTRPLTEAVTERDCPTSSSQRGGAQPIKNAMASSTESPPWPGGSVNTAVKPKTLTQRERWHAGVYLSILLPKQEFTQCAYTRASIAASLLMASPTRKVCSAPHPH